MQHSDINLTMMRYTHTLRGQEARAIESLPDLSKPSRQSQRATGTDDIAVDGAYKPAYKKLTKNAYSESDQLASLDTKKPIEQQGQSNKGLLAKAVQSKHLGTKKEPMSPPDTGSKSTGPGRIRTFDQWIMSPLL